MFTRGVRTVGRECVDFARRERGCVCVRKWRAASCVCVECECVVQRWHVVETMSVIGLVDECWKCAFERLLVNERQMENEEKKKKQRTSRNDAE